MELQQIYTALTDGPNINYIITTPMGFCAGVFLDMDLMDKEYIPDFIKGIAATASLGIAEENIIETETSNGFCAGLALETLGKYTILGALKYGSNINQYLENKTKKIIPQSFQEICRSIRK